MQRGFYSWFFNKDSTHEQPNKTIHVRKPTTALSGANTETGTITHKHTVKPRLPKSDSQSETTNDTCL